MTIEPNILLTDLVRFNLHPSDLLHSFLLWVQSLGSLGAIAFMVFYIIATVALVPGSILTLGAGVLFGVTWGSLYVLLGAIAGETVAFLLGRYLVRDWIAQKFTHDRTFTALNEALNREGWKIIFLTRLSPVFPFSLLNYAFGITGIRIKDYLIGSIGMIPMTVAYVYFGSLAGDLATIGEVDKLANPTQQWTIKIIGFVATVAATVYLTRIARQTLDKSLAKT